MSCRGALHITGKLNFKDFVKINSAKATFDFEKQTKQQKDVPCSVQEEESSASTLLV